MYAMDKLNLSSGGKTKKCATIVGEVLGHYHPHGTASVYDALVRLGQDFAQRYTTVTPQGNFGTIAETLLLLTVIQKQRCLRLPKK